MRNSPLARRVRLSPTNQQDRQTSAHLFEEMTRPQADASFDASQQGSFPWPAGASWTREQPPAKYPDTSSFLFDRPSEAPSERLAEPGKAPAAFTQAAANPWAGGPGAQAHPQGYEAPAGNGTGWERRTTSQRLQAPWPVEEPERKSRAPFAMVGIVCVLLVILLGGGIVAVFFSNRDGALSGKVAPTVTAKTTMQATTTTKATPTATDTATNVVGPSGKRVVPAMAAFFSNVQTTSSIDAHYQPTHVTSSFAVKQSIYVTFYINSNKRSGYIQVLWYSNNKMISKDKLAHDPPSNVAYFGLTYEEPTNGSAELYWCTKADCSDAQLAQVVKFKVSQAAS
ncbi:MAG: hypothetical protein J2P37_02260 [Ktedonobacteraceae bacterium]|nr:hypothetical protein [Ktedonobacteraceae bacterium]